MLILNKAAVTASAVPTATPITKDFTTTENTTLCDSDKDTLLIVEDNDELRLYMRRIFEPVYRVIDKSNAQEALEYMETQYPSLVLSDIMMPGLGAL
jgi:response regulator RpfG family c-di-GMP phosphodiesterase